MTTMNELSDAQLRHVQDTANVLSNALERVGVSSEQRLVRILMELVKHCGDDAEEMERVVLQSEDNIEQARYKGGARVAEWMAFTLYEIIQFWAQDVLQDLPLSRWVETPPHD